MSIAPTDPNSNQASPESNPSRSSRLWLFIALIGLLGLAITTYLTSTALSNTEVGCSVSGCNTVLTSKWSKIVGIPVSAFGMATYAVIMLGALHAYQSPIHDLRGRRFTVLASLIGVAASIYLTTLEIFVIKAFCQYCLASGALVVVTTVTLFTGLRGEVQFRKLLRVRD